MGGALNIFEIFTMQTQLRFVGGGYYLHKYTAKVRCDKRKCALSDSFYLKIGVFTVRMIDMVGFDEKGYF